MTTNAQIHAALRASGLTRQEFAEKLAARLNSLGVKSSRSAVYSWLRPEGSDAYRQAPQIAASEAKKVGHPAP